MATYIPMKTFRKASKPMWMNNEISQGSNLKKKKWNELKQCQDQNCKAYRKSNKIGESAGEENKHSSNCTAYNNFKELESSLNKKIRVQKAGFEEDIAQDIKHNPKK